MPITVYPKKTARPRRDGIRRGADGAAVRGGGGGYAAVAPAPVSPSTAQNKKKPLSKIPRKTKKPSP